MNLTNYDLRFKVFLTREMHECAQMMAAQQRTQQKARQVYLNCLAICAVRFYCECMEIETSWEKSESYDLLSQALFDLADLYLPGVGQLECRPVLAGQHSTCVPVECEERIGYVFVQIDDSFKHAILLGFLKTVPIEEKFPLERLGTLDEMLKHLDETRQANQAKIPNRETINLSQWLLSIFEDNWQTIERLPSSSQPSFVTKSGTLLQESHVEDNGRISIKRGRRIDLGLQTIGHSLALVVTVTQVADEEMDVNVRIYPGNGRLVLPPNLQLILLDDTDTIIWQEKSKAGYHWMQRTVVGGKPGDSFSVKLVLEEYTFTQHFVF